MLSILIVNWNVRDLLRDCLRSIERGRGALEVEVIVVDSASRDDSAAMVAAEFPWVTLLPQSENVGFPRGNNIALARARGDALLLLNPDTVIRGDALPVLVAYLAAHPDVGAVGPQLLNPDGSVQSSRRRFPNRRTAFLESTLLQRWWPDGATLRRFYVADRPDDVAQDVDWITGACMLARGAALAEVGLLDEGFFMYSEEVDWGRRFKLAGWRVVYLPTAEVMHHEGRSSEQVVARRHIYFQTSKVRYYRKWDGQPMAETLRLFLLATYAWQLAEESAKWLLGHKRPMRWERMRAYVQVLRSRLRS